MNLVLTGNEPRQRYLFKALADIASVKAVVNFDQIDFFTRYAAAALSFSTPRTEWWGNYQLHPLVQRRRQRVLNASLRGIDAKLDGLIMWGSWFPPFESDSMAPLPYVTYVDQSRSLERLPGEAPARFVRRKKSHAWQARTYRDARAILCMSKWAQAQTIEAHPQLDPTKVRSVGWGPCGVDLSDEQIDENLREPMVLHVSNDFIRKGVDFLVATEAIVRRAVPNVRFVVIGKDGSGFSVPGNSTVEFLGPIYDKQKLADYFRRASLFFLPHRFDRSPHVLVEAMSAGLPLVVSRQGGAIEIVDGTDVGFASDVGDVESYSDHIITLLRDPSTRHAMGQRARALVLDYYNWPAIARKILLNLRSDGRAES